MKGKPKISERIVISSSPWEKRRFSDFDSKLYKLTRRYADGTAAGSKGLPLGFDIINEDLYDFIEKPVNISNSLDKNSIAYRTRIDEVPSKANPVSFISSLDYVLGHLDLYVESQFDSKLTGNRDKFEVANLFLPSECYESFPLVRPLRNDYDPVEDLIKSVEFIMEDIYWIFEELNDSEDSFSMQKLRTAAESNEFGSVMKLVDSFNDRFQKYLQYHRGSLADPISKKTDFKTMDSNYGFCPNLSYSQASILLDQIYARAVTNPDALRQYKSFSPEVYGETGHSIINDIIKELNISKHDVFIDLGSGIGNVVFQVAAQTQCEVYGVELKEQPCKYAALQLKEFKSRLKAYGRPFGVVRLLHGSFLEESKVQKILEIADTVFVNNYAFGSDLNNDLMHLFLCMKEGTNIVSFKAFRPLDYKITDYNVNDIASILTVRSKSYESGCVSWTASPGTYYIHTIDRKPLKEYIDKRQKKIKILE